MSRRIRSPSPGPSFNGRTARAPSRSISPSSNRRARRRSRSRSRSREGQARSREGQARSRERQDNELPADFLAELPSIQPTYVIGGEFDAATLQRENLSNKAVADFTRDLARRFYPNEDVYGAMAKVLKYFDGIGQQNVKRYLPFIAVNGFRIGELKDCICAGQHCGEPSIEPANLHLSCGRCNAQMCVHCAIDWAIASRVSGKNTLSCPNCRGNRFVWMSTTEYREFVTQHPMHGSIAGSFRRLCRFLCQKFHTDASCALVFPHSNEKLGEHYVCNKDFEQCIENGDTQFLE